MKNTLGSFIVNKRQEKKISLRALSRIVGISPEYLSKTRK